MSAGIAGAYDGSSYPAGMALEFDEVAIDGIGVGEGERLVGPEALGFPQWPGLARAHAHPILVPLPLATDRPRSTPRLLLTTCAASAHGAQASCRRRRFPTAIAEDMEGFAVATAYALDNVPLRIVRGISNLAGDRAPENWRLPAAFAAARAVVIELLESGSGWVRS